MTFKAFIKRRIKMMSFSFKNDMALKRCAMKKSELHRHMEKEKKQKDAIAFDDCPCIYSCCTMNRKCCGQGYCDEIQKEENKKD